jgi:hypothetical protein
MSHLRIGLACAAPIKQQDLKFALELPALSMKLGGLTLLCNRQCHQSHKKSDLKEKPDLR